MFLQAFCWTYILKQHGKSSKSMILQFGKCLLFFIRLKREAS